MDGETQLHLHHENLKVKRVVYYSSAGPLRCQGGSVQKASIKAKFPYRQPPSPSATITC